MVSCVNITSLTSMFSNNLPCRDLATSLEVKSQNGMQASQSNPACLHSAATKIAVVLFLHLQPLSPPQWGTLRTRMSTKYYCSHW